MLNENDSPSCNEELALAIRIADATNLVERVERASVSHDGDGTRVHIRAVRLDGGEPLELTAHLAMSDLAGFNFAPEDKSADLGDEDARELANLALDVRTRLRHAGIDPGATVSVFKDRVDLVVTPDGEGSSSLSIVLD